jgi:hypothetical protein
MDCFIKKIFAAKGSQIKDELVHSQFTKFSRGEFNDKAMLKMKNSAGRYSLDTTSEYARELVMALAEKLGNNKTLVTGAFVSALDIQGIKYEEKKMAMGVRKYMINREMTGKEIVEMLMNAPKAFPGLSFNVGDNELVIKPKSPKSAKGAGAAKKEDDDVKIDFCKLRTSDKSLVESFFIDSEEPGAKKLEIRHDFIITDIIISPELKKEKDFAKIREMALRKGKIIRKVDIEGNKKIKEAEFLV